jgi:hypothetical protein
MEHRCRQSEPPGVTEQPDSAAEAALTCAMRENPGSVVWWAHFPNWTAERGLPDAYGFVTFF